MEKRNIVAWYQNGFRRGMDTMDPVLCLEDDIRKSQVNKEVVAAVFFQPEVWNTDVTRRWVSFLVMLCQASTATVSSSCLLLGHFPSSFVFSK